MMRIAGIVCLMLVFAGFLFADDLMQLKDQGGATKFTVDVNGNVGIGTPSPSDLLDVKGNLRLTNTANPSNYGLIYDGGGLVISSQNANPLYFYTSGAEKMRITPGGNVGIGTSAPAGKLGVVSSRDTAWDFGFSQGDYPRVGSIYYESDGSGYGLSIGHKNLSTGAYTDYVYIIDGGKVGIGTTTPAYRLDIAAPSQQYGQRIVGPADSHGLLIQAGSGSSATILNAQDSSGNGRFYVQGDGAVYMPAITNVGGYYALYLTGSGNVVKGTSSLRYKENVTDLEVKSEKIVDLQPRSFTFKKTQERSFGLIAEEVEKVLPELVVHDAEGNPDAVRYEMLSILLLKEYQKLLAENRNFAEKNKEIEDLKKRNDDLESRLKAIEEKLAK